MAIVATAAATTSGQPATFHLQRSTEGTHLRSVPDLVKGLAQDVADDRMEASAVGRNDVAVRLHHHHLPRVCAVIARYGRTRPREVGLQLLLAAHGLWMQAEVEAELGGPRLGGSHLVEQSSCVECREVDLADVG